MLPRTRIRCVLHTRPGACVPGPPRALLPPLYSSLPHASPLRLPCVPRRFASSSSFVSAPPRSERNKSLDPAFLSRVVASPSSTIELQRSPETYDREMALGKRAPDLALSKRFVSVFGHLDGMLPVVFAHWKQAEEKGLKPDIDLQVLMMRVSARAGDVEKANEFWQSMIRGGVTPPTKAFAVIIEVHGRMGDVRKAQQLFDLLQRRGLQPDILVYTVLMSCYARADGTEAVLDILGAMRTDGVASTPQTFSALIAIALQKNNSKLIEGLVQAAEQQGLQLPVATIKSLEALPGKPLINHLGVVADSVSGFISRGVVKPAIDLIRAQKESVPWFNDLTCTCSIGKLPKASEVIAVHKLAVTEELWMEAEWLVRFMAAENLVPADETSFRAILQPWTKKRDPSVAVLLIKSWLRLSPPVTTVTILELLQVATRTRTFGSVFASLSPTMLSMFESEPLTSLFSLLARSNHAKEAEALIRQALETGRKVELDPVIHLMKEAAQGRDVAGLEYWLRLGHQFGHTPPNAAVEVLLLDLSKRESAEPMEEALQWLRCTSWTPSPDVFPLLMLHHLRRVDATGALATYQSMLEQGVRPRSALVDNLVTTLAMAGRLPEAEQHFWQLQPREPSLQVVAFLLLSFAEKDMPDSAGRIWDRFQEVLRESCSAPDLEGMFTALISVHSRAGQESRATELREARQKWRNGEEISSSSSDSTQAPQTGEGSAPSASTQSTATPAAPSSKFNFST